MRILVDMDGILVDLLTKWLRVYNEENDCLLRHEDIKTFDVHRYVAIKPSAMYDIIKRPGFFDDLEPHDGAIDALHQLKSMGHDVIICSSPAGPDSARAKYEWVERHLGWNRRRVVLQHDKWNQAGDLIIDDKPSTLEEFGRQGRYTITIDHPYNRDAVVNFRAHGYRDMHSAWESIVEEIGR